MKRHLGAFYPLLAVWLLAVPSLGAQVSRAEYAGRRAEVANGVGDGLILAVGSAPPREDYVDFHQNSPFRWITGFLEPDAVYLGVVSSGRLTAETLFVNPRDPAQETWEGYRVGPEGTLRAAGIPGRSSDELDPVLDSLAAAGSTRIVVVGPYDPSDEIATAVTQRVAALLEAHPPLEAESAAPLVDALRGVKSPVEQDLMRRAADITSLAHEELMGALEPGMNEFELEALLEYTFRRNGAERPAFASIVGSGRNSTVLHYNANDRYMEAGDVVVIDIGASYAGYSADVTRTLPVDGRFSAAQREIYELVLDAQEEAERMAEPGITQRDMARVATRVLAEGLTELGLIESPSATFDHASGQEYPQYFMYFMHALGHGLGLDVHDPWPTEMVPGVGFTIEPGIYVRPNLFTEVVPDTPRNRAIRDAVADAFRRYEGIGVRIEDDYVITEDGVERISSAPREIAEIEAAMRAPWDGPADRRPEWVESYGRTP